MPIIRQKLNPGLQRHEMSLLRLFETVSNDCVTLALIQIKLTDVTDPMVNEKVDDRVSIELELICIFWFCKVVGFIRSFRRSYPQSLL
uniref:Uncharacterized protein n=1 Tax=Brassica oleracea var. oleracea TaxID=109376 RepID=A0A0D3DDV0_BRAOL